MSDILISDEGFTGYKVVQICVNAPILFSSSWSFIWKMKSGVIEACCDSCTEIPGENHSCGIYATKTPLELTEQHYLSENLLHSALLEMRLFGKIIEGTKAFRAQKARIKNITLIQQPGIDPTERTLNRAAALEQEYEVPTMVGYPVFKRPVVDELQELLKNPKIAEFLILAKSEDITKQELQKVRYNALYYIAERKHMIEFLIRRKGSRPSLEAVLKNLQELEKLITTA